MEFFAGFLVVGCADGYPIADIVAADDEATGVHTGVAHVALEHFGILNSVAHEGIVRSLCFAQFGDGFDGIGQVHLGCLAVRPRWQFVGNEFAQAVGLRKGELQHARHVFDGQLGGHGAVSDDVCHLLCSIFICHPLEYTSAAVVVEVDIDIGERNTVGVEKTLEEQVVFDGVDVGDAQAIGHGTAGRRSTTWAYGNIKLLSCGFDVVLHNQEVAGEAHGFHDVQLKLDAGVGFFVKRIAITPFCALVGELAEIVRFEFDAIEFVVSAELLDFGFAFFAVYDDIAVFILGKFVVELGFCEALSVFFFGAKVFRNVEVGHDRAVIDAVEFHFVDNLLRGGERFGKIGEDLVHFGLRFEPFLFGVEHARGIVDEVVGGKADQKIVGFGIFLIGEVRIVGADVFYSAFFRQFEQDLVGLDLQRIGFSVGTLGGIFHLVALKFEIVVFAESFLEPHDGFLGTLEVAGEDLSWNFSTQTGRRNDESFFELLKIGFVGAWFHVETVDPRAADELNQIVIARFVLGQDHKVPPAAVFFGFLVGFGTTGAVHFATENGFEVQDALRLLNFFLTFCNQFLVGFAGIGVHSFFVGGILVGAVAQCGQFGFCRLFVLGGTSFLLAHIVEKVFYAHHVAMIGERHSAHAVGHGLVYETRDGGLTVEQRVVGVNVQVYERNHKLRSGETVRK